MIQEAQGGYIREDPSTWIADSSLILDVARVCKIRAHAELGAVRAGPGPHGEGDVYDAQKVRELLTRELEEPGRVEAFVWLLHVLAAGVNISNNHMFCHAGLPPPATHDVIGAPAPAPTDISVTAAAWEALTVRSCVTRKNVRLSAIARLQPFNSSVAFRSIPGLSQVTATMRAGFGIPQQMLFDNGGKPERAATAPFKASVIGTDASGATVSLPVVSKCHMYAIICCIFKLSSALLCPEQHKDPRNPDGGRFNEFDRKQELEGCLTRPSGVACASATVRLDADGAGPGSAALRELERELARRGLKTSHPAEVSRVNFRMAYVAPSSLLACTLLTAEGKAELARHMPRGALEESEARACSDIAYALTKTVYWALGQAFIDGLGVLDLLLEAGRVLGLLHLDDAVPLWREGVPGLPGFVGGCSRMLQRACNAPALGEDQ